MTSFLQEQVQLIFDRHQSEIDEISIIIPNRRAAVYIQKYLAESFKAPFFSPEILTIHDWVDVFTPEQILSQLELLFILHEVHCEIEGKNAESFEDFMHWGQNILGDFDEIDRYMIDPVTVFRNLKDIKELESWDVEPADMSSMQKQFQQIWDKLSTYYLKFNEKLNQQMATYSGKAYLNFYEKLGTFPLKKHIYFLGFNALSKVEQAIMRWLIKKDKATAVFDIDRYYFDNKSHEAGHFYRQICNDWKIDPQPGDHFNAVPKKIEVIETSQQVAQAKIAGSLIRELQKKSEKPGDTAVILGDESLLIPLTKSLPQELNQANITMGWPIKFAHLKGFLDIIFDFQFNFQKFKSPDLYHKTLISFLQHPYVKEIIGDARTTKRIHEEIRSANSIFIPTARLTTLFPGSKQLVFLFTPWDNENTCRLEQFEQLTNLLYGTFNGNEKRKIDLEVVYQFVQGLKKFRRIVARYNTPLKLISFKKLFYQFWQNESLSFLGNPVDGLQVMGILETRAIDFKNLIILGMNEGMLPKANPVNSFIPRDLRLHLKLPTEEDRQAIYAHHFYRLLHRSENIYMTYNSSAEGLGSGEKSRFIIQLENELDFKRHSLQNRVYAGKSSTAQTADVFYKSTPEVHKRLDQLLERGLSPSALNKLIVCPLDFYYRYILKFEEADEIEESIEASTFGTKIHTVLEQIIEDNFKNDDGTFSALTIDKLQSENDLINIHKRLEKAYLNDENSKKFTKTDLKYGQNKLSFDVSKRFVGSFLNEQLAELKSTTDAVIPQHLEHEVYAIIDAEIGGVHRQIRLRGNADRIDKKGDLYRIIDYKSGKSNKSELEIKLDPDKEEDFEKLLQQDNKRYARQLLMYALMFRYSVSRDADFSAGIISMVNISDWIQTLKINGKEQLEEDFLEAFKYALVNLITKLYEPGFEFRHNPDAKYCEHCLR